MEANRAAVPVVLMAVSMGLGCSTQEDSLDSRFGELESVSVEVLRVVGTSEAITRVADIVEAPDSTIWILNATEPYFIVMTPDGSVERAWGRRGGGQIGRASCRERVL